MEKPDLILLAIDDEQILQLFSKALTGESYDTSVARDVITLDKALQETSPALMIINENFAQADVLVISATLLERFPTLPILLFLSQSSIEIIKRALKIGISDCLFAPLRIDDIKQTVANSLRRASLIGDWTRRQVKVTTASLQRRVDELQKFNTILENIEDGVIILDDALHILLINAAVRRTFGLWHDDDVNGKPVVDVLPHPDLKAIIELQKTGVSLVPHQEISFDDGRVLSTQTALIPGIGMAVTLQDITHLKHIDRLKNEFINTVSHDLRSPLTAVLGYVELLERVGPMNDQQHEFIRRVQSSVVNITTLVNNLLELGRIEAGFDNQNDVVSLDSILRYSLEMSEKMVSDKQLHLQLELPEDIPPIRGNPVRLRQMADNLLGNAIKYTPEGGTVGIELEAQSEQIILRISDSGPGIPPADQPHIFEKFYRASNVPKGVGGSGLGLAIVKSIVDSHQGRIWVESLLGHGTTFTIVLPLVQKKIG
jgi:PAS domain S-box-containing protein